MGSAFSAQRLERQPTSCRRSISLQMVYRYQIGQQFVASGAARAHAAPQSNLELAPGFTAVQKQLEQRSRSLRRTYT